ncbi:helix-hairpin-helix domain-containing protein [Demequina sp. NBRC 110052]|uniref:helix-hairpin-helix domain-containing protein n=1 Tax=Demequina sp. NBRC 110052 TaxID=1570341 RepID=UPI001F2FBEA7|nr:helix-hairpin-helix domain-containing protein [Demequina sp. NBRC 110052]
MEARWREGLARAASRAYEAAHGNPVPHEARGARWRLSGRAAASLGVVVAVLAGLAWGLARAGTTSTVPSVAPSVVALAPSQQPDAVVHVAGAVRDPGLVVVPAGSRLADAIEAAGGASDDADLDAVNLARAVADGERILVPRVGEEVGDGPVNLNTADLDALEELPGVGPVLAAAIVADRDAHGPYASVDDLERVSGVGAATLARLRPLVTV